MPARRHCDGEHYPFPQWHRPPPRHDGHHAHHQGDVPRDDWVVIRYSPSLLNKTGKLTNSSPQGYDHPVTLTNIPHPPGVTAAPTAAGNTDFATTSTIYSTVYRDLSEGCGAC